MIARHATFMPMHGRQTIAANTSGLNGFFDSLVERGIADEPVDRDLAQRAMDTGPEALPLLPLTHACGRIREYFFGRCVQVHMLHNVQCGACPEDCGYCGQAKTSDAPIQAYKLKSRDEILDEAARAKENGAFRYCMVLSGRGPSERDIDHMVECIREVKTRYGLETCLSAGLMDQPKADRLKDAGLDRLNHNLNTSEAHYPSICTTHTYRDRLETLRSARRAGLQVCSGLIVGMDESIGDVLDVAFELRKLNAESIPVNFLVSIPGNRVATPRCGGRALTPEFCLRVLCMMRLTNPSAEIRIAAGREVHLRSLQALALHPANSLFVDGYLLTRGSDAMNTLGMIRDAGFELAFSGEVPESVREALRDHDSDGLGAPEASIGVIKDAHLSERKLAKLRINGAEATR